MNNFQIIYPMFAMLLVTLVVLIALLRSRVKALQTGKVTTHFYKTYQGQQEPELSLKLSRQFSNIFEAPTLFYIVCLAAMITAQASMTFNLMAWTYVVLRVIHAYVHTGHNRLKPRVLVYFSSWAVLVVMWLYLTVKISLMA